MQYAHNFVVRRSVVFLNLRFLLIEAEWRIYMSVKTSIGSDNGVSPGRRQAIIWTNSGILLIRPAENKLQWNFNWNSYIFIQEII